MAHALKLFFVLSFALFLLSLNEVKAQIEKEIELQDLSKIKLELDKLPFIEQAERHLPDYVIKLKDWEVKANPYFTKKQVDINEGTYLQEQQKIYIHHVDIPLKYITTIKNKMLPLTEKSLIYEKDGDKWIHWFINPDDTEFAPALLDQLKARNIPHKYGADFVAYRTSSRSFIVQDPKRPNWVYNMKISTNNTAGRYKSKGMGLYFAQREQVTTDYVLKSLKGKQLRSLSVMPETGLFVFKGEFPTISGQAMAVRDISDQYFEDHNILVPGFSLFHEESGSFLAKIAQKRRSIGPNHEVNLPPEEFWEKHFVIPYASALAEFFAYTNLIPSSLHSQNFYLELTPDLETTGKVVFKDFGDVYFAKDGIKDKNYDQFMHKEAEYDLKHNKFDIKFHESISIVFSVFQTIEDKLPSWLTKNNIDRWKETFYRTFQQVYASITGKKLIQLYKDAIKDVSFVNPFIFKNPTYQQCFLTRPMSDRGGLILSEDDCTQLIKCSLLYCREREKFSPSHVDYVEGGLGLYQKMESQFYACLDQGQKACLNDYQTKKNQCISTNP